MVATPKLGSYAIAPASATPSPASAVPSATTRANRTFLPGSSISTSTPRNEM